jgi:hypothetical protein
VADNPNLPLTGAGDATAKVRATELAGGVGVAQHVRLDLGSGDAEDQATATVPVSGTVTANAGTNLNTSALALESTLSTYTGNQRASAASNTGSQVSIPTTPSTVVLAANANRKGYRIRFAGAVFVSYGGTASATTFGLTAESVDEMTNGLIYTGEISAIAPAGATTAHVVEW